MLLSACRAGTERYELTNYIGKSVKSFERKSGIKLEMLSNGIYVSKDAVQIMEQDNSVTQITLMNKTGEYTVYGVKIGMSKEDADKLLKDIFGTEITKTLNDDHNNTIYSYLKDGKELYITYDNSKNTVIQLSYYKADDKDQDNASQDTVNAGELVAIIGDTKVYYNEAMVYLKSAEANYETEYGKGIWDADINGNGKTFGKMLKDEVMNQIIELKIIRSEAIKQGIILEEDEIAQVDSYAKEHYDGLTQEDKEKYHITEELLKQVYTDNLLAEKVFENKTINVNNEVSDQESRQVTVQHILIYSTDYDSNGNKLPLSAQEKDEAYNKIQELLNQAKETNDFYALAEANTQADTIEYTFGRGKGPKEYGDAFEKAAFSLKTGQISNIITTDYGWHILYCVTDFNEDATIQAKEDIIEQRRYDEFSKVYTNWSKDYDTIINNEVWDAISLQE
jgi:foldase protein PrsA